MKGKVYFLHRYGLTMWLTLSITFALAFIAGFFTMWFAFDDLGSDVVFFIDDAELEQMHWDGLRKGPQ